MLNHGFGLKLDWWQRKLGDLPGGPVQSHGGQSKGRGRITRQGLFSLADAAVEDETGEGALRLLWPTLLWGTGDSNRGNRQRIRSVSADPEGDARRLRDAARRSRESAKEAFEAGA